MTFHVTPHGKFFCKGCQKHIPISKRHGKYGKFCIACYNLRERGDGAMIEGVKYDK